MSAATSQHGRAPATAHGVRRVMAALIDAVLVPAVVLGTAELAWWTGALGLAGVSEAGWVTWSRSYPLVAWAVTGAAFAYHGLCAARWGRTVGKRAMGLAIVTDDDGDGGGRPGVALSLWRAAWSAAIFAPTILAPAVVVVGWAGVSTASHRSLADRAAGTLVVRGDGDHSGRRAPRAAAATGRDRT
jgi:uncharacterized RDD family membrane protein YckC